MLLSGGELAAVATAAAAAATGQPHVGLIYGRKASGRGGRPLQPHRQVGSRVFAQTFLSCQHDTFAPKLS